MSVALVAGFMTLLDVSIVNVALPSIRADLDLSPGGLQWVLSGYALTFGLLLVPAGRFGDARGRRTVFIAGLAVFTLASATICRVASPPASAAGTSNVSSTEPSASSGRYPPRAVPRSMRRTALAVYARCSAKVT